MVPIRYLQQLMKQTLYFLNTKEEFFPEFGYLVKFVVCLCQLNLHYFCSKTVLWYDRFQGLQLNQQKCYHDRQRLQP